MNVPEITEMAIDAAYPDAQGRCRKKRVPANPDEDFVKNLIRGLLKNEQRYGYRACPCRLASGMKDQDLDIVCPCDYRDADIEEHGTCYCALYVNEAIATGKQKVARSPSVARPGPRGVKPLLSGSLRQQSGRSSPCRSGAARSAGISAHGSSRRASARSAKQQKSGSSGLSELFCEDAGLIIWR